MGGSYRELVAWQKAMDFGLAGLSRICKTASGRKVWTDEPAQARRRVSAFGPGRGTRQRIYTGIRAIRIDCAVIIG